MNDDFEAGRDITVHFKLLAINLKTRMAIPYLIFFSWSAEPVIDILDFSE
jgi:hypothetical protein